MNNTKRPRTEREVKATPSTSVPTGTVNTDLTIEYQYLNGFQSYFSTEAKKGALPLRGNNPQKCPFGLVAEQISGTAFTKVKHANLKTWWYRIYPSAFHQRYTHCPDSKFTKISEACDQGTPAQIRWKPLPMPPTPTNFIEGLHLYTGAGDPSGKTGTRIYMYACNVDMIDCSFCSSDGDFLIVPESGALDITTECGRMTVPSGFICVIQRGMRFTVKVPSSGARGYICEVFDNHFELPPRGVIGANGLANERDFETPVAFYEDRKCKWICYQKYTDKMFQFEQDHSPYDVVAWHGNYAPYRYDLDKFCTVNTVSFDHIDPSIFCVLTSQTGEFGVACCDFVIFPPRWMVAEDTFRPPYYHKNLMSEFMGIIRGTYEAKTDGGFSPGGASLHSCMAAHGPETAVYEKCSDVELKPTQTPKDDLAFMFETTYMLKMTKSGINDNRDQQYTDMHCWQKFPKGFDDSKK